jgi:hypothetical protein
MRTRNEADLARIKEEYGDDVMKSVVKAVVGTGMVENASYNNGKPYFVAFRPIEHDVHRLLDDELENYNKYNALIDDLDYQLEQLKELGEDTFDLELELKLAKDKVKSGNFNMVDIYLEGLTPRIKEVWGKLGKTPKKRELLLVSETELMEEFKKAQSDRTKTGNSEQKPPSSGVSNDVDTLINQTNDFIKKKDKKQALALYAKIQQLYKALPQELKKRVYEQCIMLQKQLAAI